MDQFHKVPDDTKHRLANPPPLQYFNIIEYLNTRILYFDKNSSITVLTYFNVHIDAVNGNVDQFHKVPNDTQHPFLEPPPLIVLDDTRVLEY